ncbi:3-dehydroshikimate dehydratase [Paramyrothecium foliicola]|nr:3-dehydroshikimate dehydratase [Paramyrothecium foliicola]
MSLGKPGLHSLTTKLEAAASKGFRGVELFWDDLEAYAGTLQGEQAGFERQVGPRHMVSAARKIQQLCSTLNLSVISVQPFRNFDGLIDADLRKERIDEFKVWLLVAQELHAEFIGVPATIQPNPATHTGDMKVIVWDLKELTELAKPYNIRIAYENLCFAAHTQSWPRAWEAVTRTGDAANIGFLADTFNLCAVDYADPSALNGKAPKADRRLEDSMERLAKTIPSQSICFLQVADAEFMDPPISAGHPWMGGCFNAKMAWSRNARLFPFEKGGYLPVISAVEAVIQTGWSGWVSMEVFSRSTGVEGEATVWEHADRAWTGWARLASTMGWPTLPASFPSGH